MQFLNLKNSQLWVAKLYVEAITECLQFIDASFLASSPIHTNFLETSCLSLKEILRFKNRLNRKIAPRKENSKLTRHNLQKNLKLKELHNKNAKQ